MRFILTVALAVVTALAVFPQQPSTQPDLSPVAPAFDIRVEVFPSTMEPIQLLDRPTPESFTCRAMVFQPGTNKGWVVQELTVGPGGRETTSNDVAGMTFTFAAAINKESTRADTLLTITRDGRVLSRNRVSSLLPPRARSSIIPVE
jgi:hypothetical protein